MKNKQKITNKLIIIVIILVGIYIVYNAYETEQPAQTQEESTTQTSSGGGGGSTQTTTQTTCADGTITNQCAQNKPEYCDENNQVTNNCQLCGCPNDEYENEQICQTDGSCQTQEYLIDFTVEITT